MATYIICTDSTSLTEQDLQTMALYRAGVLPNLTLQDRLELLYGIPLQESLSLSNYKQNQPKKYFV
jgi:hypothetical protein